MGAKRHEAKRNKVKQSVKNSSNANVVDYIIDEKRQYAYITEFKNFSLFENCLTK